MSTITWLIRLDDQVLGPISDADLRDRAMQGSVVGADAGVQRWTELDGGGGRGQHCALPPATPSPLPTEPSSQPPLPTALPTFRF